MKITILTFVLTISAILGVTDQTIAQDSSPADIAEITEITEKISKIDEILKRPYIRNMFDPATGEPVEQILENERNQLVQKRYELEMASAYGSDALQVIALQKRIIAIEELLKKSSSWIHQAQDLEGRSAYEIIQEDLENLKTELEGLKAKHDKI